MEQREHMGHRKAAAFGLVGGLAEVCLQGWSVRHGKAGAVQGPGAMTAPAARGLALSEQGIAKMLQKVLEQGQWQALAGTAISRGRERYAGQARQSAAGRIAVENLKQTNVDGGGGIKNALSAHVSQVATDLVDNLRRQGLANIGLETT